MGQLMENTDGSYTLKVKIGCVTVEKTFKEIPKQEQPTEPASDGFYLYIPDIEG